MSNTNYLNNMCAYVHDELSKEDEELETWKTVTVPRLLQPVLPTPELTLPILLAYSYINSSTSERKDTKEHNKYKQIYHRHPTM